MGRVPSLLGLVPRLLPRPRPYPRGNRVVVMLHGTGSEPGVFRKLAQALREHDIHPLALSYGRRGTDDLDRSVEELEQKLLDIDAPTFDIVGHSLGGLLALRLAHRPALRGRIGTIVGLGAAWRGVPDRGNHRLTKKLLGESFVQVKTAEPFEATVPEGVTVVSVVSDADKVVPSWSSRLGHVIELSGVSHSRLVHEVQSVLTSLRVRRHP